MPGTNKTRIIVQCSRCPVKYSANQQNYLVRQKAGLPNFCPACLHQLRCSNTKKANEIRVSGKTLAQEFWAPCRMRIVPEEEGPRSRCKPALAGRCPEVEDCVDFAARNGWQGWKVAQ